MIFPNFLQENDTIGITACSTGVLDKIDKYELSLENIRHQHFKVVETPNVRTNGVVSSSPEIRAHELLDLFNNKDVKLISIARGGDFLSDMLSVTPFEEIVKYPKWLSGSSDPTSLLYILTTKYDIATIYSPCNMTGLYMKPLHQSYINYFKIIKGDLVKQYKYDLRESTPFSDILDSQNEWLNINGDVDEQGRLIGGCLEVLKDIIGTKFDNTLNFLEKYQADGFIWYFDVFNTTSEGLYNTLIQFNNAGWFTYTKVILIGKVALPNTFTDMTYEELIKKALPNIKIIYNFDIGHVKPSFTMINGAKVHVISNDEEGSLEYIK